MTGTVSNATDGKLSLRVERDVTPLIPGLYRRAVRITNSHADAEDLLQETIFRACRAFRTFRAQQRRPAQCSIELFTAMQLASDARQSPTSRRSAEDQLMELLPDEHIRSAMQALPDQFRTTVYYADVEGYRYSEIAELTDAPVGTVMSRLHRGRRQLRRRLAGVARERGFDVAEETYDMTA